MIDKYGFEYYNENVINQYKYGFPYSPQCHCSTDSRTLSTIKLRLSVFLWNLHIKGDTEMGTLYEKIISLCEERGIKGGKMCTDIGMSKGILTDLKMGRQSSISTANAQKIASYFGVSVGYLLGEEEKEDKKRQPTEGELSIRKKEFMQKVASMSDDQIARLEQILALVEKTEI